VPVPARVHRANRRKTLILIEQAVDFIGVFLPNLSSICHSRELARVGGCRFTPTSAQSYPQLLWVIGTAQSP
jgi:hypothetical protein